MMVASLLEIVLGFSGLLGFLLRYIGPLVICPTISLLGLSLSSNAASMGAHQWWICLRWVGDSTIFNLKNTGTLYHAILKSCHL